MKSSTFVEFLRKQSSNLAPSLRLISTIDERLKYGFGVKYYGDQMSGRLPVEGYERRLLDRIEKIEKELKMYMNLAKRLQKDQTLSDLKKGIIEQLIRANVESKKEELERIKKELDNLYYRTGLYLGQMGKKLERFSKYIGKSKSQIVREALEEYMARHGW